jgi:hypothetical protein
VAITNQSIVDMARVDVNDAAKDRHSDANGMAYLNDFIQLAYSVRPDLRFGSGWPAVTDLAIGANFPLSEKYRQAAAAYVVARWEAKDDEHSITARFATMLKLGIDGVRGL